MSVIRKKPFIQTLVEDLTEAQKASLLGVMNGSGSTEEATFGDLPEDAIAPVLFKFSEVDSKTGILIQSDNYTVLIAYHRFQDLLMFKINSNNTYEKINEYLDINELRNLLEDSGDVVIGDDLAVGGKLEVTGTAEFKDSVEFKDDVEFKGDMTASDTSKFDIMANIVDADGHNRFVQGDIDLVNTSVVTKVYGKWSLNGTHLMIVIAGTVANEAVFTGQFAYVGIPDWVKDKIVPTYSNIVEIKSVPMYSSGGGIQNQSFYLYKINPTTIRIDTTSVTLTADRSFRVQFDLLIDND